MMILNFIFFHLGIDLFGIGEINVGVSRYQVNFFDQDDLKVKQYSICTYSLQQVVNVDECSFHC